jgi:hypothetical protein
MPDTEEGVVLKLPLLIIRVEEPANREWILDTYVQCLAAVRMEKNVVQTY